MTSKLLRLLFEYRIVALLLLLFPPSITMAQDGFINIDNIRLNDTVFLDKYRRPCKPPAHIYYRVFTLDSAVMHPDVVGKLQVFYRNKRLAVEGYYDIKEKKPVGLWEIYNRRRKLKTAVLFDINNNLKHFDVAARYQHELEHCDIPGAHLGIYFYNNRNIKNIGFINNDGCTVCILKEYYRHGKIFRVTDFGKDRLSVKTVFYYKNGNIMKERYYNYGKKAGVWKQYKSNGQLKKSETHKE